MADIAELLASYAEPLTLFLILASTAFFVMMAVRARSLGSLQVQLSIGLVVWATSEVPHIFGTIGLVDIQAAYADFGLWFHFLSMFILASFIAIRSPRIFAGVRGIQTIESAAFKGLMGILGESGARAATFYLDISKARNRPSEFVTNMRRMFSAGSAPIERKIAESLATSGLADPGDVSAGKDLVELLVKAQLKGRALSRPP